MFDSIQKMVMAGIGAAAVTADKVEEVLGDLVKKGKITTEEAKEAAKKITDDGRKDFEDVKGDMSSGYESALKKLRLVTQEQFQELEARLKAIEEKLNPAESTPEVTSEDSE